MCKQASMWKQANCRGSATSLLASVYLRCSAPIDDIYKHLRSAPINDTCSRARITSFSSLNSPSPASLREGNARSHAYLATSPDSSRRRGARSMPARHGVSFLPDFVADDGSESARRRGRARMCVAEDQCWSLELLAVGHLTMQRTLSVHDHDSGQRSLFVQGTAEKTWRMHNSGWWGGD